MAAVGPDRGIHDFQGLDRIKFVTNYPRDMTDDLLAAVRDLPKVARYLHVPAQSGCDDMLKRMKRGYTVADYRDMMERINATVPDCAVSSDFIVGFCGESVAAHEKSLDLIREFRFKNSFIFKYSPRGGTKADDLYPDDVPEVEKRRRNNEMLALQNQISFEDNLARVGRTYEILVEGLSKTALKNLHGQEFQADAREHDHDLGHGHDHDDRIPQLVGRTRCDRIVVFPGNPRLIGHLVDVRVESCTQTTMVGRIETGERLHLSSAESVSHGHDHTHDDGSACSVPAPASRGSLLPILP